MSSIIEVKNLSKSYTISHEGKEKYSTLRDVVARKAKKLFSFPNSLKVESNATKEEFWALKEINFEIAKGDRVGIIGRNGAGKSTLLKILSRIVEPTSGSIKIKGRVASLLEVGTGFHPELSGRENIFLNGAILGMSRAEIRKHFDAIVDFAEIEKFLDTPVKRYSSGMYVRLAFAVAAHLEPEILIVDEVLAVGDADFQKKCLGKMEDVSKNEGRTVLFVSHDMNAMQKLCKSTVLLNKGSIETMGMPKDVIECYFKNEQKSSTNWSFTKTIKSQPLKLIEASIREIQKNDNFYELKIDLVYLHNLKHKDSFIAVDLLDVMKKPIMQSLPTLDTFLKYETKTSKVHLDIKFSPLIPGEYYLSFWAGPHNTETLDFESEIIRFEITESPTPGRLFPHTLDHGYIVPFTNAFLNGNKV